MNSVTRDLSDSPDSFPQVYANAAKLKRQLHSMSIIIALPLLNVHHLP